MLELEWRQVVQAAVRPDSIEVTAPGFDDDLCLCTRSEPLDAQAFVAQLAVEAFVVGVLPRLAGIDQGRADAGLSEPLEDREADNSGPLSERRKSGAPCWLTRRVSTSIKRLERIEPATSMARHSRVNSSMIVRHLSCWPLAQESKTKS
jgi:hypothetical protein